jgi:hypothetical protein
LIIPVFPLYEIISSITFDFIYKEKKRNIRMLQFGSRILETGIPLGIPEDLDPA